MSSKMANTMTSGFGNYKGFMNSKSAEGFQRKNHSVGSREE